MWLRPALGGLVALSLLCAQASAQKAYIGHRGKWRARMYEFKVAKLSTRSGSYSNLMVVACRKSGMKPVCEHPNFCARSYRALYLGQRGHLSAKYVKAADHLPGFDAVRQRWDGLCFYTDYGTRGNSQKALCNIPASQSVWRTPAQANPGFPCGREGAPSVALLSEAELLDTNTPSGCSTTLCSGQSFHREYRSAQRYAVPEL